MIGLYDHVSNIVELKFKESWVMYIDKNITCYKIKETDLDVLTYS